MITNVSLVSVWVTDLDDALAFYTDVLGFEARDDIMLGEDFRWVTVGHPNQPELQLHLRDPWRQQHRRHCCCHQSHLCRSIARRRLHSDPVQLNALRSIARIVDCAHLVRFPR